MSVTEQGTLRSTLSNRLSNWEAIEMYEEWRRGATKATLSKRYKMSDVAVRDIINRIEEEAGKRGLI